MNINLLSGIRDPQCFSGFSGTIYQNAVVSHNYPLNLTRMPAGGRKTAVHARRRRWLRHPGRGGNGMISCVQLGGGQNARATMVRAFCPDLNGPIGFS